MSLEQLIGTMQREMEKFMNGNKSAGTRVRKHMQMIKGAAQNVRKEVQEMKNA